MSAINPWILKTTESVEQTEIPESGFHKAVLVAIVDLGTHSEVYKDQPAKDTHKILLAFELVEERLAGTKWNHVIGREFTLSLNSKAGLRLLIEGLLGNKFTNAEEEKFDISSLKGRSCWLTIEHGKSKTTDRKYAIISKATKTKGNEVWTPMFKPFVWAIGDGEPPVQNWLPPVFVDQQLKAPHVKIKASQELAPKGNSRPAPDTEAIGDEEPANAQTEEENPF